MDTKQFKKILKESLESGMFLGIEEARIPADQVPKNSMRYALVKYIDYIKQKYLDDPESKKLKPKLKPEFKKRIKKDFIETMKDLRLFDEKEGKIGIDADKWAKIYPVYHKESKVFRYKGEEIRGSDAIWNILKIKLDRAEKAGMSKKEFAEFSQKKLGKIADQLENVKEKLEKIYNSELNYENFITVLKNMALAQFINEPEDVERIMDVFPHFVKQSIESSLNKENPEITRFYDGLIEYLQKSPLFSSSVSSDAFIKRLYDRKMYFTLNMLDKYLEKDVSGGNKSFIDQLIAGSEERKQKFNEGIKIQHKEDIKEYLDSFLPFAKKRLGYDKEPKIDFISDPENGKMPLGKTAYYEPATMSVTVFVDNRHPKDIMRSLSHELVHHTQNCDGQFDLNKGVGEGYAQNDEHLRKMEEDAYLRGNMCFRDWEDGYKKNNPMLEQKERLYYELMRRFK